MTFSASASPAVAYQYRLVAFVDILGFRQLVQKSNECAETRNLILQALSQTTSASKALRPNIEYRSRTFSDNIVISSKAEIEAIFHVFGVINSIILNLLEIGVLCRGGITIGNIIHNDEVVVGDALVRAYELESMMANFPRIIIDQPVIEILRKSEQPSWLSELNRMFFRDFDGVYCLHYLRSFEVMPTMHQSDNLDDMPINRLAKNVVISFSNEIEKNTTNPRGFEKMRYFSNYWNSAVARSGSTGWRGYNMIIKLPQNELQRLQQPFKSGFQ